MKHTKYLRRYIVNADDFGMDEQTNKAILEEFLSGNITSASLMVNREGSKQAIRMAQELELDVGLHLELTTEYIRFFVDYFLGLERPDEIYLSIKQQIEKFIATGLPLNRIDSHLGVHFFPGIWKIIQSLMTAYKITHVRNPIRKLYFNVFNIKRFIHDNIQWLFFKLNSNRFQSMPYMVELDGVEVVAHIGGDN